MSQDIRIPDIGDADDVEVVEILVAAGDTVGKDDPLIVIESDKASMEVPAGAAGTVAEITVAVGDKVAEGQVIARLESATDEGGGDDEADGDADTDSTDAAAEPEPESAGDAGQPPTGKPSQPDESADEREVVVEVPDIGEADDVEVIEVAVAAGDQVAENDLLVVVESDKASMEIPSTHAGTVREVHVSVGTQVQQGTQLVTLLVQGGGSQPQRAGKVAEADEGSRKPSEPSRKQPAEADKDADRKATTPAGDSREAAAAEAPRAGSNVYAGPAVRRLARELGVDLQAVPGTGNRGRIVKDDVNAFVKARMTGAAASGGAGAAMSGWPGLPEVDFSKFGEIEVQALSRTRARGAENLHKSWINLPHVTQHDEVDVTDLEDFRGSLKAEGERRGVKVTPLAFIIKACVHVLKEFPTFNASLDPAAKHFILKRYYHIGMAVDTPDGLVVPVIHDADTKGVWELSAEIVELAEKARNRKLGVADMQGGTFSISSLGAIGGTGFTPIINAPEVAILGVGRLTVRPVWQDEAFLPRKLLPLSLSYDHRAINGAEAGRFVARLGELLADIRRLAL